MKKVGRPEKIDNYVLSKLEEAFKLGCPDDEACFSAGISTATLYRYQKENPEFRERKDGLKKYPIILARQSVIQGLLNDPDLALKFLERRKKDEFSTKSEIDKTEAITFEYIEREEKKVLNEYGGDPEEDGTQTKY